MSRVILDASVRRLKAQGIYLRASAALRWVSSRNAVLGGQQPQPVHQRALQQILNALRAVSLFSFFIFFFFFFILIVDFFFFSSSLVPLPFPRCTRTACLVAETGRGFPSSTVFCRTRHVQSARQSKPLVTDSDNPARAQELSSITIERIELSLRSMDTSQGKWLAEDPSLALIQQMLRLGR